MNPNQNIDREISGLRADVKSILTLLKGNEHDKDDKGMIGIQRDHHKRLTYIETWGGRILWATIGLGAFAGWGIIDIITKIIFKK
jgi:hypothetical protein